MIEGLCVYGTFSTADFKLYVFIYLQFRPWFHFRYVHYNVCSLAHGPLTKYSETPCPEIFSRLSNLFKLQSIVVCASIYAVPHTFCAFRWVFPSQYVCVYTCSFQPRIQLHIPCSDYDGFSTYIHCWILYLNKSTRGLFIHRYSIFEKLICTLILPAKKSSSIPHAKASCAHIFRCLWKKKKNCWLISRITDADRRIISLLVRCKFKSKMCFFGCSLLL